MKKLKTPADRDQYQRRLAEVTDRWRTDWPMSVRQVYYQMVGKGYVDNSKKEYERLSRQLKIARLKQTVPWAAVEDRTRNMGGQVGSSSPEDYMDSMLGVNLFGNFTQCLMHGQENIVHLLIEKDALLPKVRRIARPFCVPVTSTKGSSSTSLARELERYIDGADKLVVFLFLSDFDPEGCAFAKDLTEQIKEIQMKSEWPAVRKALIEPVERRRARRLAGLETRAKESAAAQRRLDEVRREYYRTAPFEEAGVKEARLEYITSHQFVIQRVGLTQEQAEDFGLPVNFNSVKTTSSKYKEFYSTYKTNTAYELDAMSPDQITTLVEKELAKELDIEVQDLDREAGERAAKMMREFGEHMRDVVKAEWPYFEQAYKQLPC